MPAAFPYEEMFFRNNPTITHREQTLLRRSGIAIIGLGGSGGFAFENLLRVGIENFVLFDSDRFELSNLNRQLLSTTKNPDMQKTSAAVSHARAINPGVKIKKYPRRFLAADSGMVAGCDIVLDCTDNIESRFEISDACRGLGIPFVFSSASFSRGMVSVFMPNVQFGNVFQFPRTKSTKCRSVICPAPSLAGTLAASQAISFLLGKKFVKAPDFIFFDLFSKEILWKKRL